MTLKISRPIIDSVNNDSKVYEDRRFDQIFKVPSSQDSDTPQNFCTAVDLDPNSADLLPNNNVLDCDGVVSFELNFYVDMEEALRGNVRKVRFKVYTTDPRRTVRTDIDSRVGTNEYYNERYLLASTGRSSPSPGPGYGNVISSTPNNEVTSNAGSSRPSYSLTKRSDGSVKTWTVDLGVTDSVVAEFVEDRRRRLLSVRNFIGTQGSRVLDSLAQNYSVEITPKINVNNNQLQNQIAKSKEGSNLSTLSPTLAGSATTKVVESVSDLSRDAFFGSKTDPASVFDMQSFSRGFGSPSITNPKLPKTTSNIVNEVAVGTGGKEYSELFKSATPVSAQASVTQKTPQFSGIDSLEKLYNKTSEINMLPITDPDLALVPIKKIYFRSSLVQHREEFNLSMGSLRPYINSKIYVRVDLLNRDGSIYKNRVFPVELRSQMETLLTPTVPPDVRIVNQRENNVALELKQRDPLAVTMSVYRMVARPNELDEAEWKPVALLKGNIRSTVSYVDDKIRYNVAPNVVMYDVRCTGPLGGVCSSTKTIVEAGVKRLAGLNRNRERGDCSIAANQRGKTVEVTVSRVPPGVERILLKRQLINTALREKDYRKHRNISTSENEQVLFYRFEEGRSEYKFIDRAVSDRQVYRYYAQFDWKAYPRSNSSSEDYIEYRKIPTRPIASSLTNVVIGREGGTGSRTVQFDLDATFSNEGLESLNRLLGDDGVSNVFVEELRKDRSLIANLLLFEVTRKNLKTGAVLTFPLVNPGTFTDNQASRRSATAGAFTEQERLLNNGGEYQYRARLLIVNPERFFREALTRIPTSTKQIITDTNPNFVEVSAARFAENFALQPGTIPSPSAVQSDVSFSLEALNSFTGIEYLERVNIPRLSAVPTNVSAARDVDGRPENVISWSIIGSKSSVHKFLVTVTVGREQTVPLMAVSPNISDSNSFTIRDSIYSREIVPVSYAVQVLYTPPTLSLSAPVKSNEIHVGTEAPVNILDLAVKKWITRLPPTRIADITKDSYESRLDLSYMEDPLYANPLINNTSQNIQNQLDVEKSIKDGFSPDNTALESSLNPKRDFRE